YSDIPITETHTAYRNAADAFNNGSYTEAGNIYASLLESTEDIPEKYRLLTLLEECAAKSGDYEKAYGCSRAKQEILTKIK
nr:hypothetical protein [Clostridia bacterium]